MDAHLLTAIRTQTRYPVIVLSKAVTAFLAAIVPVKGRPNCKTLNTQAKYIRVNSKNHLVIHIAYKKDGQRKHTEISTRQIAYFIARKRFPPEGMVLACSCGYYHCVEYSHLFKELNGSQSTVKRNHKRDYRSEERNRSAAVATGGRSSGGYTVETYSEVRTVTDPSDMPLWADLDTPTVDVKAETVK